MFIKFYLIVINNLNYIDEISKSLFYVCICWEINIVGEYYLK